MVNFNQTSTDVKIDININCSQFTQSKVRNQLDTWNLIVHLFAFGCLSFYNNIFKSPDWKSQILKSRKIRLWQDKQLKVKDTITNLTQDLVMKRKPSWRTLHDVKTLWALGNLNPLDLNLVIMWSIDSSILIANL